MASIVGLMIKKYKTEELIQNKKRQDWPKKLITIMKTTRTFFVM